MKYFKGNTCQLPKEVLSKGLKNSSCIQMLNKEKGEQKSLKLAQDLTSRLRLYQSSDMAKKFQFLKESF